MSLTNGQPWRQQYAENTAQTADITGWAAGTSLPIGVHWHQAAISNGRVFIFGGVTTATVGTVYSAPANPDGTFGAFASAPSLPGPLSHSQCIIINNRIYLIGGATSPAPGAVGTIYTAVVNADGTIGTWTTATSLPGALARSQAVVTKGRIYLLGGMDASGTVVGTVYTAAISPDGTIGAWSTGTSLPGVLSNSQAVVTNGRVYLLGGITSLSTTVNTVYTAVINLDGTIGAWTTTTSLPGALQGSSAVVTNNRVYLLGGEGASGSAVSTGYTAAISPDGTIGAWSTGTSLPSAIEVTCAVVTNSKVYLLGGWTTASSASVKVAAFAGGKNNYLNQFILSGNIAESLGITNWRVAANDSATGALGATTTTGEAGSTYSLSVPGAGPYNLTLSPKIDYAWTANKAAVVGTYVVAANPDASPHLWKCTVAGTTHAATEPAWNLSGTTADGTVTWLYIAPLVDPISIGPKIPVTI